MPMSVVQEYLYFLAVAALYGALPAAALLVLAWRRQRLNAGLGAVLTGLPLIALGLMLAFRGSASLSALSHDNEEARIAAYLGEPSRSDVIEGVLLAPIEAHGRIHDRYQFPSLDGDRAHALQILIPTGPGHRIGRIEVVRPEDQASIAPARLVLQPSRHDYNPAVVPAEFFSRYHSGLDALAFGRHTLVLSLRPDRSVVVRPRSPPDMKAWEWTDAQLSLP